MLHRIRDKDDTEGSVSKSLYTGATWGDDQHRSRVGSNGESEECDIPKPALTITLFVQEDVWEDFVGDKTMRQNGTISRICAVNPPSRVGTRLEKEEEDPFHPERISPFTDAIMCIRQWKLEKPVRIRLSKCASRARRDFYNSIEKESGPGGIYEDVADIVGRACSWTTRIATIFAVFEAAEKKELGDYIPDITEKQWLRAQAIEEYFLSQSIDAQRLKGHAGREYLLQKTAKWLQKDSLKELQVRLAQIKKFVRGLTDETIKPVIQGLKDAGWIREEKVTQRGFPTFEINPKITTFRKEEPRV